MVIAIAITDIRHRRSQTAKHTKKRNTKRGIHDHPDRPRRCRNRRYQHHRSSSSPSSPSPSS